MTDLDKEFYSFVELLTDEEAEQILILAQMMLAEQEQEQED